MPRYFNNQEVELLAPAGTFPIFTELLDSNCDAFYLGGKQLNMRLHRKDFNFSHDELVQAVALAHGVGKKVYVTLNSLHSHADTALLDDYLGFLATQVKPDGIILQDLSVYQRAKAHGHSLPMVASVMMNVHNTATAKRLHELGFFQVVASREAPLSFVKELSVAVPDLQHEYFVHGDMCVAHGGMCLYSGMLFGGSSNRGRCFKPCRWNYDLQAQGAGVTPSHYPLAVKDMCMYEHIPELIASGVKTFKIEGRMRDAAYLKPLINAYGDAIERYIQDPLGFNRTQDSALLHQNRKRDMSTAYAFGTPGLSNINARYEGTGKFYSTGKPFSQATEEKTITPENTERLQAFFAQGALTTPATVDRPTPTLTVRVNDYDSALMAVKQGVNRVIVPWDYFVKGEAEHGFTKAQLAQLTGQKRTTHIYLGLPRMMFDADFDAVAQLLSEPELALDGLVCTSLGAMHAFKDRGLDLMGDYTLNIFNGLAADFYQSEGLSSFVPSVELPKADLLALLHSHGQHLHVVAQGSPVVMYMEHDLYQNLEPTSHICELELPPVQDGVQVHTTGKLTLIDEGGYHHPVYKDRNARNNMLLGKDISLLPILPELVGAGLRHLTLELMHLTPTEVERVVTTYTQVISNLPDCAHHYTRLAEHHEHSFGALIF